MRELALLAMSGAIQTIRFGSNGKTAIIKSYDPNPTGEGRVLTEHRLQPIAGEDGVNRYDVSFLTNA